MSDIKQYLADIGARGGAKKTADQQAARRRVMADINARKKAKRGVAPDQKPS